MAAKRHDDPEIVTRTRSRRVYRTQRGWYFDSREGPHFGPFASQRDAENALAVFFAQHAHERPLAKRQPSVRPGAQDGIDHMVHEVVEVLRCHHEYGTLAARTWAASRLDFLEQTGDDDLVTQECIGILRYVIEHSDQVFDFDVFLSNRA